ncbi:MFS transporter [uncultured Microbacterium sp.]|uniref:MFS transporter n=1 Tax=uncultured Microbacterium sp. TaxID=191216 RepID=UPI0025DF0784|nr:MFS transporter [uncultured Microbacterium sp.]
MTSPTHEDEQDFDPVQERRVLIAGSVGSVIEWYDFGLFGAASALVIGPLFFSSDLSPAAATLASFATFAVGFFARPLGGLLIGNFGDRFGRKPALIFTLVLMGVSTFLMGCLPTYQDIGLLAPVLLVILRLAQGAGAGAELAGTFTIIVEATRPSRRAFNTAVPNGATAIGSALGVVSFLLVDALAGDQFLEWAWRVPFLVSIVIFFVAFFVRRHIEETPAFLAAKERASKSPAARIPAATMFRTQWRGLLLGFGIMVGHQAMSYVTTTFALSYITTDLTVSSTIALTASLIASLVGATLAGVFGHLADRLGAPRIIGFGAAFCLVTAFPAFLLLDTRVPVFIVLALLLSYSVSFGAMAGGQGAILTRLFPANVRYTGVAMSRELAGTIIGGPSPLIAAALVGLLGGQPWLVAVYLVVCCSVTLVSLVLASRHFRREDTALDMTTPATTDGGTR